MADAHSATPEPDSPSPSIVAVDSLSAGEAPVASVLSRAFRRCNTLVWCGGCPETSPSLPLAAAKSLHSVRSGDSLAISSLITSKSLAVEGNHGVALLQKVHASFPHASIDDFSLVLSSPNAGKTRLCRTFKRKQWKIPFDAARKKFVARTLATAQATPNPADNALCFDEGSRFVSRNYNELEMDFLVKLPAMESLLWQCDPNDTNRALRFVAAIDNQRLPDNLPFPVPSLALRESIPDDSQSCRTEKLYPARSSLYVLAEAYAPLPSTPTINVTLSVRQKLLQLERSLTFLIEKESSERKTELFPCDCILGVLIMGPCMTAAQAAALFASLSCYHAAFPCLWALQQAGRFLALQVESAIPAASSMVTEFRQAALERLQRQTMAELKAAAAEQKAAMDLMTSQLALLLQQQQQQQQRPLCVVQ